MIILPIKYPGTCIIKEYLCFLFGLQTRFEFHACIYTEFPIHYLPQ